MGSTNELAERRNNTEREQERFRVEWAIELPARSPRRAAEHALTAICDQDTPGFTVTALSTGAAVAIDLDALDDDPRDCAPPPCPEQQQIRRQRLNLLLDSYRCKPENWLVNISAWGEGVTEEFHAHTPARVPYDAAALVPRWVLICERERKLGFAAGVARRSEIPAVAADGVGNNWQPRCYYDLDEPGQQLAVRVGDRVEMLDAADPEPVYVTALASSRGTHLVGLGPGPQDEPERFVYPDRVRGLDRAENDPPPRLPRRYLAGEVVVKVRFEDTPADTHEAG